jgi:CTP:molybdopterin cytidylyltransferase MocA
LLPDARELDLKIETHGENMPITTLILASGTSPALGYAKANLRIGSQTFIEKVALTACSSGSEALIITVGEDDDPFQCSRKDVQPIVQRHRASPVSVFVAKPDQSNLQAIVDSLKMVRPSGRVLLWPIDYPFADSQTVKSLLDSFGKSEDNIAYPKLGAHMGYPILLGVNAVERLVEKSTHTSLSAFIQNQGQKVRAVPTTDPRVVISVNLPEQAAVLGVKSPERFHQYL